MSDELRGLLVFARVVEQKSFSKAAAALGITRSAVSKHVAQLEAELGAQLLVRTTRKLALTEVGERVYAACADITRSLERVREAVHSHTGTVAGHLRVAAPASLGRSYLVALVVEFLEQHPAVTVELLLGDAFVDLVGERVDLALRVGHFVDSTLVTRRIAQVTGVLCAAPSYLKRRGMPKVPSDLSAHEWIHHAPGVQETRISFRSGPRAVTVQVKGRLTCNDGAADVEAAARGFGLVFAPDFEVFDEVKRGRLVPLLSDWQADHLAVHAVSPPRRHVTAKERAFVSFVAERWKDPPWRLATVRSARGRS